jgi:hypothetical protein
MKDGLRNEDEGYMIWGCCRLSAKAGSRGAAVGTGVLGTLDMVVVEEPLELEA